jgi:nucleotidyltransferase/DNA polymerase involved in DNA repair
MDAGCLFIRDFYVALARRDQPALRGRAVIIGGSPDEHAEVKACSVEAAAAGVTVGTTLRRALALCPDAVFLPLQETHAAAEAERISEVLRNHSPIVEVLAPGHAHIDLRGLAKLARMGEGAYLADLHEAVTLTSGLAVHLGAAETVFTAHAAAVSGAFGGQWAVGSGQREPEGRAILVEEGMGKEFLAGLPVEILPLAPDVHQRLHLLGLDRVGQVAELPFTAAQAQFGPAGARAWELANGKDDSPIVAARNEVRVSEELELPAPTSLSEPLVAGTRSLLLRALGRREVLGHSLRRLDWRLLLESGEAISRRFVFREPTNDATRMLFVVRGKVERLQLPSAAVSLGVTLSGLCSEYGHQANLWNVGPRRQKELRDAIEQLNARVGEPQVYRIVEVQPWSRIPERQLALAIFG